jgi:hypothetical protein
MDLCAEGVTVTVEIFQRSCKRVRTQPPADHRSEEGKQACPRKIAFSFLARFLIALGVRRSRTAITCRLVPRAASSRI